MRRKARPPRLRRRLGTVAPTATLLGVALTLASCGGSGYVYVSHRSPDKTNLYFKLPASWTSFNYSSNLKAANGALSAAQLQQIQILGAHWYTSFSSVKHPTPDLLDNPSATHPEGLAFAAELSPNARDAYSLSSLRSEILGTDPLSQTSTAPSEFKVLNYSEFTAPGGLRGSRLVTDITPSGGFTDTYAQVVEVDQATNWVFGIAIGCRASCWGPNSGTIDQILNTWQVKEQANG